MRFDYQRHYNYYTAALDLIHAREDEDANEVRNGIETILAHSTYNKLSMTERILPEDQRTLANVLDCFEVLTSCIDYLPPDIKRDYLKYPLARVKKALIQEYCQMHLPSYIAHLRSHLKKHRSSNPQMTSLLELLNQFSKTIETLAASSTLPTSLIQFPTDLNESSELHELIDAFMWALFNAPRPYRTHGSEGPAVPDSVQNILVECVKLTPGVTFVVLGQSLIDYARTKGYTALIEAIENSKVPTRESKSDPSKPRSEGSIDPSYHLMDTASASEGTGTTSRASGHKTPAANPIARRETFELRHSSTADTKDTRSSTPGFTQAHATHSRQHPPKAKSPLFTMGGIDRF